METKTLFKTSSIVSAMAMGSFVFVIMNVILFFSNFSDTPSRGQLQAMENGYYLSLILWAIVSAASIKAFMQKYENALKSGAGEKKVRTEATIWLAIFSLPAALMIFLILVRLQYLLS